MSATVAPPVDTLLSHFAEPLRRQLAQQALQHDKAKVEKILRDRKLHKGWASQSLPRRQDLLASYTCFEAALCRLVLHGWLKRNELLRQRVWADLQAAGYEPALPDWGLQSVELPYQSLLPGDVLTEGDQQYFAPGGIRTVGVALESYTLMAHLLGWSAMAAPDEEATEQVTPELVPTSAATAPDDILEPAPATPKPAATAAVVAVPLAADQAVSIAATQLEKAIDQLEAAMHQLAIDHEEAARQLRLGHWPSTRPELAATGLQQVATQLGQQAGAASIAAPTLVQLRQHLVQLQEVEQQRQAAWQARQQAIEVLAAVARVRHRQAASFTALEQPQAQATALAAELHDAPLTDGAPRLLAAEAALLEGTHPLARFLALVRQTEELADDTAEMQQAEELMQDLGGRELARAWLRGNLLAQPADEQPTSVPDSVASSVGLPNVEVLATPAVPTPAQVVAPAEPVPAPVSQPAPPTPPAASLPSELPVLADPMPATDTLEPEVKQETPLADYQSYPFDLEQENNPGELPGSASQTEPGVGEATSTAAGQGLGQRQWELLAQGDLSLAYQLARCAEELNQEDASRLPAWLLRSLALGPHVQAAYGRLATLLAEDSRKFDQQQLAAAPGEPAECRQLLAWAAALRPALLAPATLLNGWLSLAGVPGLPQVNDLANRLAKRQSAAPLDEALLDALQTHQQWQTQMQGWQADLDEWNRQQEQAKFRQSITNDIVQFWRSLWQPGRPVAQVLARLATPDPNHSELLDALAALRNRSGLRDELKRSKIDFSIHIQNNTDAQRWLDERVALLADLVRQHQELWHRRPAAASRKDTHYDDQELLHYLHQQLPAVLTELTVAEADSTPHPLPWRVALALLRQSVAQLHSWLAHPAPGHQEVLPRYWLGPALLRVPGLELTADWEPLTYDQPLEQQLWHLAGQGPADWPALYEAASHEAPGADHLTTARLLALAEATVDSTQNLPVTLGQELATLRTARQASIERQRYQLGREVDKVERELVRGYRYGYLGGEADARAQQDVKELKSYVASGEPTQAEVQRLRQNSQSQSELGEDSIYNFRAHQQAIRHLHAHMADLRHQAIAERTAEVERELQTLISPPSPDDQRKLQQALQEGRLTLVDDYLARLRVGRDLGPHDLGAAVPCMAHLRARLLALAEVRQQHKPAALARQLARGPLLPTGQPAAEGVAEAYSQWVEIRQNKTLVGESSQTALRHLFEFLGFEVEGLEPAQALDRTGPQYVDLRTRTLRDRQQCPVGRFGSEAKGHYRVLSVWNTPDPTELSRLVAKCSNRDSAVLVLLWEALPWPQREELGLHCRREGLSFLVFDELLLLYLLTFAAPAKRLGLFFQLQLPFAQLNPYQVSGKIPSEMFFGREQEKRRLVSHQADGAIIVYGGRQLGKTMLLHQAVRENHCPEEERYVVFRDIYQLGRDIQNINRLGYELMQLCRSQHIGEWPVSWREDITPRRVLDHLTEWVLAHPRRTLLVLLDEADELLEQDAANDFALVSELRRAMDNCRAKDESGTRLKIVFSGLHNVQRTLNLPNQPFVQLGKPMNIGPLEPEQGIALVRSPLESLGFCFGQLGTDGLYQPAEALLDQIAVETNYYPSLMQIFCYRLLERLYQRQQRHATLLTDITEEDVQYASQSARAEINNRFDLTLDLNPRYRLLAFIIADLTTQAAGLITHERGLLPLEVREFALEYWPAGWKIRHEESYFKALLDEMVELGVLEKSQANQGGWRYRLRTANVRAWLGSPEAIRKVLNDFANELPNTEYQPDIVRARFPAGPRSRLSRFRGPLTVAAVGRLEAEPAPLELKTGRVSIVCGTRAAGLGMLPDFLARRFQGNFEEVSNLTKFGPLGDKLDELLVDRKAESMKVVQVLLVTGNCTGKWVQQALDKLRPGKRRRRPIHVVFEMDPATLRRFLSADITLENLQTQGVELLPLTPWEPFAVKRWLEEEMLAGGSWREVAETTGGWHLPLHEFYDLESKHGDAGAGTHLRRIDQELQAGRYTADFHTAEARPFLRELARDWGLAPFSLEEAELVNTEALGPDDLRRELRWAEMLRLIRPLKDGKYEFDPVAAAALRHES